MQTFVGEWLLRTVNVGTPQVTAKVTTLEDIADAPTGLFDADPKGGDTQRPTDVLID